MPRHHEVEISVDGDILSIPTLSIIDAIPQEYLHQNWHNQLETAEASINFNKSDVLNVLQQGAFRITVGPLACLLPITLVSNEGYSSQEVTEIALDELLEVIPSEWFTNPHQSRELENVIASMDNPFELAELNTPTSEPQEDPIQDSAPNHETKIEKRLSKATVLPQVSKNNDRDMAITQEMDLPNIPDFISSSNVPCPETAQFSVSDFWDKENDPQRNTDQARSITPPSIESTGTKRTPSSVFDSQESEPESLAIEVDDSELEASKDTAESDTPSTSDTDLNNRKTDFDLSTSPSVELSKIILEDPKETVCMYTRPQGDIVLYAECLSFSSNYILSKIERSDTAELHTDNYLEIPQQDILNIIKTGQFKVPQLHLHRFLNLPNGSAKAGDLLLPLTEILPFIPKEWLSLEQDLLLENVLFEMTDIFTENQLEELSETHEIAPQIKSLDLANENEEEVILETSVSKETVAEDSIHEKETRIYSDDEGSLMDNLIGANSSIMSFLQGGEDEETEEEKTPHIDTTILEADKSGISSDLKTHKTIHIGLSKQHEVKEAPPIRESLAADETSLNFLELDVEDNEVDHKAVKGMQNSHFRQPPKARTSVANEYDMDLHNLIEDRNHSLNPHAIPQTSTPERKATKKSNQPHINESASVAPNGIKINQCSLDELLLICDKNLAQKVLDGRTEPYPSLESLKHQAQLSDDEYHTLTGLSPKEYHVQKEHYLFSIAGETNDSSVNTFIKQLKDKCEFDFIMISTLDGLNISDCGTTNSIDKEELAAYIPKLISAKKEFLENTNIPQAQDFSFYLGDNCLSVSITGNIYFTCIHSSPWPNTNQLKFLHSLRELVAWYFSYRLVL
ncbi:hypothetical protein PQO03_21115 [Lentisphaera profundi]|uniref:Roadblock/LAMTOR2 domain-containing protein n=1 Tax=Lentisphaera profundi TaxID=1658616 RepID=A0ABY7VVR8_9BACT|nr:hypothetical protein [Lentisphaera profundi]WDE98315.1 hypothetical protein PQO03_21115 [Lentisphaera profundi]